MVPVAAVMVCHLVGKNSVKVGGVGFGAQNVRIKAVQTRFSHFN